MNHVPAYVPQPVFGGPDQAYPGYCGGGYVPQGYNANNAALPFDPNYMVPNNNPYMAPAGGYGAPPPVMNPEYMQQTSWGPPQPTPMMMETPKPQDDGA